VCLVCGCGWMLMCRVVCERSAVLAWVRYGCGCWSCCVRAESSRRNLRTTEEHSIVRMQKRAGAGADVVGLLSPLAGQKICSEGWLSSTLAVGMVVGAERLGTVFVGRIWCGRRRPRTMCTPRLCGGMCGRALCLGRFCCRVRSVLACSRQQVQI